VIVRQAIPILRCSAGGLPMGFAAEEVIEFQAPEMVSPHLATLLGMLDEPLPFTSTAMPIGEKRERKTLRLCSGERVALVAVDGPLSLRAVGQAEVLPLPKMFRKGRIAPVIGFAEEEGLVVLLLDVPGIIHMAEGARVTETRTGS
jgi:hypothetical protein